MTGLARDRDGGTDTAGPALPPCGEDPAAQPERCIDDGGAVRCRQSSGFGGDELALCEPDAGEGLLLHFGPSDYSDPDEIARYL